MSPGRAAVGGGGCGGKRDASRKGALERNDVYLVDHRLCAKQEGGKGPRAASRDGSRWHFTEHVHLHGAHHSIHQERQMGLRTSGIVELNTEEHNTEDRKIKIKQKNTKYKSTKVQNTKIQKYKIQHTKYKIQQRKIQKKKRDLHSYICKDPGMDWCP